MDILIEAEVIQFSTNCCCEVIFCGWDIGSGFGCQGKNMWKYLHLFFEQNWLSWPVAHFVPAPIILITRFYLSVSTECSPCGRCLENYVLIFMHQDIHLQAENSENLAENLKMKQDSERWTSPNPLDNPQMHESALCHVFGQQFKLHVTLCYMYVTGNHTFIHFIGSGFLSVSST